MFGKINNLKRIHLLIITFMLTPPFLLLSQNPAITTRKYFNVSGFERGFNVEISDLNKDENLDIIVGDWNNDANEDFLLKQSGFKMFPLHLGEPHINNINPYGMRGLLEAVAEFPSKAIGCGDQNGDGINDFVMTANPYSEGGQRIHNYF